MFEAKQKEGGIDPISVYEIIKSFPVDALYLIKWSAQINRNDFINDLQIIADDILKGTDNSLHS